MHNLPFNQVELYNGFWKDRYELNANVSIYAVQDVFEKTGRFDAVRFVERKEKSHVFYDSDVAKWIEAVAYLVAKNGDKYAELVDFCDELISAMCKNQRSDGYFNSYFQRYEPEKIFQSRNDHELYCAGHLIEAAIAYDCFVKKSDFLHFAEKYAHHIYNVFYVGKSAGFATCGHEEIELALFKLYAYTGKNEYRELAEYFVNARGANSIDPEIITRIAIQDNAPARSLEKAEGHAVRALYYYCAMADMAKLENDLELKAACKRLFRDIVDKKMYITGGTGSTRFGEAFTFAYDLPNDTAYAESCAGIATVLFCLRMNELEPSSEYADVIERVLYNVFLSSTSLDGKSFFYENPLGICRREKGKETGVPECIRPVLPIWTRKQEFSCSCCPPNINRMAASIGQVIYAEDSCGIYINQYIASSLNGGEVVIQSQLPQDGKIRVTSDNYPYKQIFLRKPAWCNEYSVCVNGVIAEPILKDGYLCIDVNNSFDISLDLQLKPVFIEANPRVRENVGKVCLMYGATVYCLEEKDNGPDLFALYADKNTDKFEIVYNEELKATVIKTVGYRVVADDNAPLYGGTYEEKEVTLTFIPYYTFANRGESDMVVWINSRRR